jgi:hypothetical protein
MVRRLYNWYPQPYFGFAFQGAISKRKYWLSLQFYNNFIIQMLANEKNSIYEAFENQKFKV